jgi:RNA polymerase sigma factor (sigma-70 family)
MAFIDRSSMHRVASNTADPMSTEFTPTPDAAATAEISWTHLAGRYLSMALRYDYLSNGRGHQQSRRVVQERRARRPLPLSPARGTHDDDGVAESDDLPSGPAPFLDCERRYLAEVAAKPRLTSREEYCLFARLRRGDRAAYEALIEANLGLVVMYARRYQRPGLPLLDLIAEGNFGLMSAAERFDPELGCRFATYAKWWVRKAIQRALPGLSGAVRLPLSCANAVAATAHVPAGTQAPPDLFDDGSAANAGEDGSDTSASHGAASRAAEPGVRPAGFEGGAMRDVPRETSDAEVLDSIAIDPDDEPPNAAMAVQRLKALRRALESLCERDRIIVCARYALDDDCITTLGELALRLNVSTERVRQLEAAAIKKLGKALGEAGESADSLL